jgi:hypothetical protein
MVDGDGWIDKIANKNKNEGRWMEIMGKMDG